MNAPLAQSTTSRGWQGRLKLGFRPGPERTVLGERERHGPLAVQRPFYPEGQHCHVYLLHPPGGVVGGDALDIDIDITANASALITSPGANKFYRSSGPKAHVRQRLRVANGGVLEWLPQENICFPGALIDSRLEIDLQTSARLAAWEIICLGRPVIGESFHEGGLDNRLVVRRDGRPLLLEQQRIQAPVQDSGALTRGRPVLGTLLLTPADNDVRDQLRELCFDTPESSLAVTLLGDLIVMRYLGDSTAEARDAFTRAWSLARPKVIGLDAHAPRIWAT